MEKQENQTSPQNKDNKIRSQNKGEKTRYDYILEVIVFLFGIFDQVSDILVIFTNQLATSELQIAAIVILTLNFFMINFFCFFKVIQCSYWKPIVEKNSEKKKNYMTAYIFKMVNIFILSLNYIISFIICQSLAVFILWFGFSKLISFDIRIQNFMSEIFIKEDDDESKKKQVPSENTKPSQSQIRINPSSSEVEILDQVESQNQLNPQQEIQNNDLESQKNKIKSNGNSQIEILNVTESNEKSENQKKQLVNFQLMIELVENIFENIPQLILQIVNQAYGGSKNQTLNKLSIISALFSIILNMFFALKMQNNGVEKWYQNSKILISTHIDDITDKLNKYLKVLKVKIVENKRPILLVISCLYQVSIYILVTVSYKWDDYAENKSKSYGKDTADSTRTFIILFPIALFFCAILKHDKIVPHFFWPLKDIVFIQFFVDALAFHPQNMNYGQKDIGNAVFIFFSVLGLLCIIINTVELFAQQQPLWCKDGFKQSTLLHVQLFLYLFIKSFQQFVNFAHYYSWEDGSCDDSFHSVIRAYLILYFFKFLLYILQNAFYKSVSQEEIIKNSSKQLIAFILLISPVMFLIIDSVLLSIVYKEVPCGGDLPYVKKHSYNLIFEICFDLILLIYPIYKFQDKYIIELSTTVNPLPQSQTE